MTEGAELENEKEGETSSHSEAGNEKDALQKQEVVNPL